METLESKIINDFLAGQAKIPLTETPMFKLVWSDEEVELRTGMFPVHDAQGRLLCHASRTDRVPKYNWMKERWILEQWYPPEVSCNPELPESNQGSFEPIFVFEDKYGRALPLRLLVVEIILQRLGQPTRSAEAIKADLRKELDDRDAAIDKLDWDFLNDESHIVSMLHDGSSILVPNHPEFKQKGSLIQ